MKNNTLLCLILSFFSCQVHAQDGIGLVRNFADSVSAQRMVITDTPGNASNIYQSDRLPAFGYLGYSLDGIDCAEAFQNQSSTPIVVNLVATFGHSNMTGLLVKRSFGYPWVSYGFVRDGATTSVIVPPEAIYCPTTNTGGEFWVTVTNPVRGGNYIARIIVSSTRSISGRMLDLSLSTGECFDLTSITTELVPGGMPIETLRGSTPFGRQIAVSASDSRISLGACQSPVPVDNGGAQ